MQASVVICAYTMHRWEVLTKAIRSVLNQTTTPKELILVIDNNETLRARAADEFGDRATVIGNVHDRGLSGGRQSGADIASGNVIVFLDDDAVPEPDWLEHMLAAYDDPQVLGSGGRIDPAWVHCPDWFPEEFHWVVGCTYAGMPVGPRNRIRNPIGACMSVRADVYKRLGGFAPQLGRREGVPTVVGLIAESCEETEFAIRAAQHFPGGYWRYCPKARVHHLVPMQRATWKFFVDRCRREGRAKAVLAGLAGSKDSLGSERRYILTLVRAVARDVLRGRIRRGSAMLIGLSVTAQSYFAARRVARRAARRAIATSGDVGYNG